LNSGTKLDERNVWLIRLYYVFYFAGLGAISPFLSLFYVSKGLVGTQIGIINSLVALCSFISAPIWGWMTDNTRRPRQYIQLAMVLNMLALYMVSRQSIFLMMAAFVAVNALASGGINPLSQIQALTLSGRVGAGYGSIRLCGSLGWAISASLSGFIIQRTSLTSGFFVSIGMTFLAALILFLIREPADGREQPLPQQNTAKIPMMDGIREIFKNRELVAYLIALIVVSIMSNGVSFESVFLQQLGASKVVIGRLSTLGAVIEMPMMLLADRLMRRKGSTTTLILGWSIYVLGFLAIVIHPAITSFIVYKVIVAVSFSLFAVSNTYFVMERSPAQSAGTILAFFSVTVGNILAMVSAPISGKLFDLVGPYWLYVIAMCGYAVAAAILVLTVRRNNQMQQKTP
jgi:MFS transporter, PPP family, 3-phenylpropionic acid transporter